MFLRTLFMAVLMLVWLPASWAAQVYQWTDANGTKHYSNTPPPDSVAVETVEKEIDHDPAADRIKAEEAAVVLRDADFEQQHQDEARRAKAEQDAARKALEEKQNEMEAVGEQILNKRKYLRRHGRQDINTYERLDKEINALKADPNADRERIRRLEAEQDAVKEKIYTTPRRSRKGVGQDIQDYRELEKEVGTLKKSQPVDENTPE